MRRIALTLATVLMPLLGTGCNAYRLDPPAGFAEAGHVDDGVHMKANNNVGLRVSVKHNVKGGTLVFWSQDLVEKLGKRGYELTGQSAARSKNRVDGTRFDFQYTPVGKDEGPRFYTVVLFATDDYRVILEMAGHDEYRAQYAAELDGIVGEMKVRGCKVRSKICKGPQPGPLSTPPPAATESAAAAGNDEAPAAG